MSQQEIEKFWEIAAPWLERENVTKGTIMGFSCMRVNGDFFATIHRDGDAMIIKLPATRVQELIASGTGAPFSPAGRTFKEWVALSWDVEEAWPAYLEESYVFVGG